MTNEEIKNIEKSLQDIVKLTEDKKQTELMKVMADNNIFLPSTQHMGSSEFVNDLFNNIHTFLQTKMMLNACVSAKWSCRWAAVAATVSLVVAIISFFSLVATWIMVFYQFIAKS
ncbi:MAG: hypothetical protein ACYSR9_11855 [Planctomycetota bacterium]|jgi:hypothetical protein